MMHGGPATSTAHKQTTVAYSSTDAEYMALADAAREAIARIQFFQELNIPSAPVLILADSQTAIDIVDGTAINHIKTKHIDIRYHALRHYIQETKSWSVTSPEPTILQTYWRKRSLVQHTNV